MTACARTLTEKGTALKDSMQEKNNCKRKSCNTQSWSGTSSHKKKVAKANNTQDDSSSSLEDDSCPQKWHCQPDPKEIVEIDDGDSEQPINVVDEGDDSELDEGDEELEPDVEGSEGLDTRDEEPANGLESDIELLDSTISHRVNFQRQGFKLTFA